jgi:hypothetical protein
MIEMVEAKSEAENTRMSRRAERKLRGGIKRVQRRG